MKHYTDPVLSRIQSHLESQLRKHGDLSDEKNLADQVAQHPKMEELHNSFKELNATRRSRTHKFSTRIKSGPKAKPLTDTQMIEAHPLVACTEIYAKLAMAHIYGDEAATRKLAERYEGSKCDVKWIRAIEEYLCTYGDGRGHIPYVDYQSLDDFVIDGLDSNITVGILGDWGSGGDVAIAVLEKLVARQPDLIIHLGDVYYSGTIEEYEHKFDSILREKAVRPDGSAIPIYNMTGNHDMYSGGHGYYQTIKSMNEEGRTKQEASYFCLKLGNASWQLLAADSSYHDHDPFTVDSGITYINPKEIEWHKDKIRKFPGKTVFFTHHQPFSAYEQLGSLSRKRPTEFFLNPKLMASYRKLEAAGNVPLWIWGHEHNMDLYQPFAGIERGRCVGHSAVPVLNGTTEPYNLRSLSLKGWLFGLLGLLRGKWGIRIHEEFARLWSLRLRPDSVPTPALVEVDGTPVQLGFAGDEGRGNDEPAPLDAMYRHGYTLLTFTEHDGTSDLVAEYFDDYSDTPLWSEEIPG